MIVRRTLRDDAWKVAAYTAILLFNLIATLFAYPTFEANYQLIMNLVPDFFGLVKQAIAQVGTGKLPVFAGINHFFKGANIIGPAGAIVLALGTVVREVEIGTIGLLLSRPITRGRILLSFAALHLLELIVPLLAVSLVLPPAARIVLDREVALLPFLLAAVHGSAFLALVYCMALFFAVVFTEQVRVAAVAGGICVLSFMLYFIDPLRPFTLYQLSSMEIYLALVQGGAFPWLEFSACLLLGGAFLGGALATFARRDY